MKNQILWSVVMALTAGCATVIQTQPQRMAFINEMGGREAINKSLACDDVTLDFLKTEHDGADWYDWYRASGCGMETELVTKVSQRRVADIEKTRWTANLAASPDEFRDAATEQLKKTASFDLGCKNVEYTRLNELIEKNHGSFQSTIGASGCGKKATYQSVCVLQGLKNRQHDIVCQSTAANTAAAR